MVTWCLFTYRIVRKLCEIQQHDGFLCLIEMPANADVVVGIIFALITCVQIN